MKLYHDQSQLHLNVFCDMIFPIFLTAVQNESWEGTNHNTKPRTAKIGLRAQFPPLQPAPFPIHIIMKAANQKMNSRQLRIAFAFRLAHFWNLW